MIVNIIEAKYIENFILDVSISYLDGKSKKIIDKKN